MSLSLADWPTAAFLVDNEGRIVAANRAAAKLFGHPRRALSQRLLAELIKDWSSGTATGARRPWRLWVKGRRADGSSFDIGVSRSAVESNGTPLTLVSVRPAVRRLMAADQNVEQRLRAAVKAGGIGTWIWDLRSHQVWWDDAMYELWNRRRQEELMPAAAATELIHEDDRERTGAALMAFLKSDADEFSQEFRVKRRDSVVQWIWVSGRIERDAQGKALRLIGATMDVTARKQAEESMRRAQKIEALGTLAGGIAHDFNNILLAIAGNTRLAMTELPPDHPVQRGLGEIDKASARATDLVNRILTFSRQSESRREVVALRPTIEEAVTLLRATLPAMIEIRLKFDTQVPAVHADSTQIHQIVMNLITNSAHAIGEESGVVTIELDVVELAENQIAIPELKEGRYVRLCVSDTGCGMDKATIERMFDPFFTTKPAGTGLGLSVVHGIMRNHEGAIVAESEPGLGSRFQLYFPAATVPAQEVQEPQRTSPQGGGQRVMYVDDEEALVFLMTRLLTRSGYRVTGFIDPNEALQALRQRPQDFDVIVTDVAMPGMSGFHLARAMLEVRSDLPIVMTSGYVRAHDREAARKLGVRDLILKPDTVEELTVALEKVFKEAPPG